MYLGYQNGKIKFYTEEMLNPNFYKLDKQEYTDKEYILDGEEYVLKDETWGEKQVQKERERLNRLTCTALDIVTLVKTLGLTDTEILQYLQANPSVQLQLTLCQNVYCGVVRQLCPLKISDTVTLTDEMVVSFFKKKHNIV